MGPGFCRSWERLYEEGGVAIDPSHEVSIRSQEQLVDGRIRRFVGGVESDVPLPSDDSEDRVQGIKVYKPDVAAAVVLAVLTTDVGDSKE